MIDFYNGQITDIMPNSYTQEASVQAISLALRDGIRLLYDYAAKVYMYASIETMPEELLDYLAIELRTQYYSQDMDIGLKRQLISNTFLWYMQAGTPAAVEELLNTAFNDGTLLEWFEYGGDPYTFMIVVNETLAEYGVDFFAQMVKRVKNTRSHLDSISVSREADLNMHAGIGGHTLYIPAPILEEGM